MSQNNDLVANASRPLSVLVIGANGYLGSAVSRAFLRADCPSPHHFRVYGLVRRESTARSLAADEVIPIVASLSDPESATRAVVSRSATWDVIVVCTEPAKADPDAERQHWRDVLTLVQNLARSSTSAGARSVRPLVLWSSGCKDYGTTGIQGDADLQSHTEDSPLVPHPLVRARTDGAVNALEKSVADGGEAGFDLAILRATPLYGYSGSYYGAVFDYVDAIAAALDSPAGKELALPSPKGVVIHGIHVDDCGDAYVALAKLALFTNAAATSSRDKIAGQVFNVSSEQYETLEQIGHALAREYGFTGGAQFNVSEKDLPAGVDVESTSLVFKHSQWVNSDKIRALTGWKDSRVLFHDNIHVFRMAYQAAKELGSDNVTKSKQRMAGVWVD